VLLKNAFENAEEGIAFLGLSARCHPQKLTWKSGFKHNRTLTLKCRTEWTSAPHNKAGRRKKQPLLSRTKSWFRFCILCCTPLRCLGYQLPRLFASHPNLLTGLMVFAMAQHYWGSVSENHFVRKNFATRWRACFTIFARLAHAPANSVVVVLQTPTCLLVGVGSRICRFSVLILIPLLCSLCEDVVGILQQYLLRTKTPITYKSLKWYFPCIVRLWRLFVTARSINIQCIYCLCFGVGVSRELTALIAPPIY
jgi:hypothetical protein